MDFESTKLPPVSYSPPSAQAKAPTVLQENTPAEDSTDKTVHDVMEVLLSDKYTKEAGNKTDKIDEKEKQKFSEKEVDKIIHDANVKLAPQRVQFAYKVHDITKQLMIKIVESDTKKIIKEIPSEKNEDALAKMWELAGLVVDEKR